MYELQSRAKKKRNLFRTRLPAQ